MMNQDALNATVRDFMHKAYIAKGQGRYLEVSLETLLAQAYQDGRSQDQPSSPWIDASERTPDTDRLVLCKIDHSESSVQLSLGSHHARTGFHIRTNGRGNLLVEYELSNISRIQWMEIPE